METKYFEELIGLKVGVAVTGSFCTVREVLKAIESLVESGAEVYPVLSNSTATMDTRFIGSDELKCRLKEITGNSPICTIQEAEPIGPKKLFDVMTVMPCTGNTLSKLANSVVDSPVLMAVKSHLRNNRPVVLAVSTNDGLMGSAANLGKLLARKNIFFVPFGQDDYVNKPYSLVANFGMICETVRDAFKGEQIQPLLLK